MDSCENLLNLHYPEKEILKKREAVRRELLSGSKKIDGGKITSIANSDLSLLFMLYDRVFFGNYFRDAFKGNIRFSLSARMTRSAGKAIAPKNLKMLKPEEERYEIRIGVGFFFEYYNLNREKPVNGIVSRDSLEALQLVFEHELCHLIEFHCFRESSCKKSRFKEIATRIFGHKESLHMLPTTREIDDERYNLKLGDTVSFESEAFWKPSRPVKVSCFPAIFCPK